MAPELVAANEQIQRRARQFEAIADVARVINKTQALKDLLPQITQAISGKFGYYHVGIFLLDVSNEFAALAAANSQGGQRMLARNHRLKVGQVGIVGYVAGSGAPRIALDTGADAVFFNNPDLPETRSEIALPLTERSIPIIADDYVDPEFGSGCVKITPAHDFNDYAVGQRHGLPLINIFTPDAAINDNAPERFRGLDRFEAQQARGRGTGGGGR